MNCEFLNCKLINWCLDEFENSNVDNITSVLDKICAPTCIDVCLNQQPTSIKDINQIVENAIIKKNFNKNSSIKNTSGV